MANGALSNHTTDPAEGTTVTGTAGSLSQTRPSDRPLSVLQIATSLASWGGCEVHLVNLATQLAKVGVDVTVACQPDSWVHKRAIDRGLNVVSARVKRQFDFTDFNALNGWIRSHRPDIVHVHASADMVVPPLAARMAKVGKVVCSRHVPFALRGRVSETLFNGGLLIDHYIPVSKDVASVLMGSRVPEQRLTVIHNSIDAISASQVTVSKSDFRTDVGMPDEAIVVALVGRINKDKGHQVLIEAAGLLEQRHDIWFLIVGNGPEEDLVAELASKSPSSKRIRNIGFRNDMPNVLNSADIVVVPSTWREPCSTVILESMALGVPVVGTNIGGTPEIIDDGVNGLLCEPKSASSLRDAILNLANDVDARRRMGANGRKTVNESFTMGGMTNDVIEVYRRLLAGKG